MKIKLCEFKSKLVMGVNDLVDTYFAGGSVAERLMSATVKIIINQNVDKVDDFLELFADKEGYIDTDLIMKEYGKAFGSDKLILDLRDFVESDMIKKALPNKAIAIRINDLADIFERD